MSCRLVVVVRFFTSFELFLPVTYNLIACMCPFVRRACVCSGNVNPIGIRACYDEGKRAAATLMFDYNRMHGTRIRYVCACYVVFIFVCCLLFVVCCCSECRVDYIAYQFPFLVCKFTDSLRLSFFFSLTSCV